MTPELILVSCFMAGVSVWYTVRRIIIGRWMWGVLLVACVSSSAWATSPQNAVGINESLVHGNMNVFAAWAVGAEPSSWPEEADPEEADAWDLDYYIDPPLSDSGILWALRLPEGRGLVRVGWRFSRFNYVLGEWEHIFIERNPIIITARYTGETYYMAVQVGTWINEKHWKAYGGGGVGRAATIEEPHQIHITCETFASGRPAADPDGHGTEDGQPPSTQPSTQPFVDPPSVWEPLGEKLKDLGLELFDPVKLPDRLPASLSGPLADWVAMNGADDSVYVTAFSNFAVSLVPDSVAEMIGPNPQTAMMSVFGSYYSSLAAVVPLIRGVFVVMWGWVFFIHGVTVLGLALGIVKWVRPVEVH